MILFCTSFNGELYQASGKRFIKTFNMHQKQGKLFIGYEEIRPNNPKFITHDLTKDTFLQCWLKANEDVIPKHLGGLAKPCKCSLNPFKRKPEIHEEMCHFKWFNRNASRWFRKVATVHAALDWCKSQQIQYLIWIDIDCYFKGLLTEHKLRKIFKDTYSLFYMRGSRTIPECGVFGFDLNKIGAHNFLFQYFNYYQTKRYQQYNRWDDSFIFYRIIKEKAAANCICRDIASKTEKGLHAEVLEYSMLKAYLGHNKGRHGRILGIMK